MTADFRDVVEKAKHLFLTKNEGNLLQDFVWQCQRVSAGDAKLPNAPVDKATAQQHGNQTLDGLRTLGTLLISNGQFRKLLSDATVLIRDIAGDAATSAASRINPSEDQLSRIDHPAEDNTWHDVPSVTDLKGQARGMYDKNKPFSMGEAKAEAQNATDNVANADDPQAAAQGTAQGLGAKAQANIPEDTRENANKTAEPTRNWARGYFNKKMPQERRDQVIWRLKKMVVEIQNHPDFE